MREYERFSTTCANAYVQPLMARYLESLQSRAHAAGFACPLLLMTSGGGLTTLETAVRFPIRLVESGPAGGVILSTWIAENMGIDRILSFDMGGTTAKICIIDDGKPMASRSFEVDRRYRFMKGSGLPVRIPVIEMVEIGAGGGSLAGVDPMKRITVGPESAGSDPGPACYRLGGTRPAVTDANVVLGRIDPDRFAGGSIQLDASLSRQALDTHVGGPLDLDTTLSAFGVSEVVEENMANAARVHAVERGAELEGRTLIAFGGGAPLHAARLAEKLGIADVLIPASAGVGSAVGFLRAPIAFEVVRSRFVRLSALRSGGDQRHVRRDGQGGDRRGEARRRLRADQDQPQRRHALCGPRPRDPGRAAGRAVHQGVGRRAAEALRRRLPRPVQPRDPRARHRGRRLDPEGRGAGARPSPSAAAGPGGRRRRAVAPLAVGTRTLFDPMLREFASVPVYARAALKPGQSIQGPAVIAEDETTTIITSGFTATLDPSGAIRLLARKAVLQEAAQ